MSKITISDVARAAGCSKSTVSFAINRNHPISEEMRAKIQQAIEELGYHPKGVRRTQQRRCIALFIHHSERPDVGETTATFSREISNHGFWPQMYNIGTDYEKIKAAMSETGKDPRVAGVINLLPRINSIDLLKYCRGIPSVIFLRDDSMLSSITMNYHHRMTLALDHLAGFGHRNIAFIVYEGSRRRPVILKMEEASRRYRTAENEALSVRVETFWAEQDFDDEIFPLFDRIYADGVTAVITETLFFAAAALRWGFRRGIAIPKNFSVLAMDNSNLHRLFSPSLTAVHFPMPVLAKLTVDELMEKMAGKTPASHQLNPQLIPGESTGPVPVK